MGYIRLPWCAENKVLPVLNLMVHACLLYRSFGAWPKIGKQQLFSHGNKKNFKMHNKHVTNGMYIHLNGPICKDNSM